MDVLCLYIQYNDDTERLLLWTDSGDYDEIEFCKKILRADPDNKFSFNVIYLVQRLME